MIQMRAWVGGPGEMENVAVPTFVCDFCHEQIRTVEDGVVITDTRSDEGKGEPYEIWFVHHDRRHMPRCHRRLQDRLEAERGTRFSTWLELSDFLYRLRAAFPVEDNP